MNECGERIRICAIWKSSTRWRRVARARLHAPYVAKVLGHRSALLPDEACRSLGLAHWSTRQLVPLGLQVLLTAQNSAQSLGKCRYRLVLGGHPHHEVVNVIIRRCGGIHSVQLKEHRGCQPAKALVAID